MCRVVAKFVPKLLSQEHQQLPLEVARDMLERANGDPEFLMTVITGDETWVYGYDPETKVQSSQWKHSSSPRPKKAQRLRSKVKVLLTVFFEYRGIVHHSYAPAGQTINKEYYLEVIHHLRDAVRRKRPDLWASRNWQLLYDNAPAHSSHLIQSFLVKHGIPVVPQAPYSPDMAPCDFWLFPKLKRPLKGSRFDSREDIIAERDEGAEKPSRRSFPEMLPAVEGTLG
jgi:transposase